MGLFQDIFDYGLAVGSYWLAIMGFATLLIGDLADWFGARSWLDQIWPRDKRRPLQALFMVILVFFGGFSAWREQKLTLSNSLQASAKDRDEARGARQYWLDAAKNQREAIEGPHGYRAQIIDLQRNSTPSTVARYLPAPPVRVELSGASIERHLDETQKAKLLSGLKKFSPPLGTLFVFVASGDAEGNYALDFMGVLKSAGVEVAGPSITFARPNERGILVGVADPSKPNDRAKQFLALLSEAGLDPHYAVWMSPEADFDLYVGRQN